MAWGIALAAWLAAALWVGAVGGETILAVNRDDWLRLRKAGSEFPQLAASAGGVLRGLQLTGALLLAAVTVAGDFLLGAPSWLDAGALLCASVAALLLVFHVERPGAARDDVPPARVVWRAVHALLAFGALAATSWSLSVVALTHPSWINWAFLASSGALIGTILTSAALLVALNRSVATQREFALAAVATRWSSHIVALTLALVIPIISVTPLLWNAAFPLAALVVAGLVVALGALVVLRFRLLRDLWGRLAELPLMGLPDRRLRTRALHWKRAAQGVIRGSAVTGVILLALSAPIAALAAWPAQIHGPWQAALGVYPAANAPTATPTLKPQRGTLLANQNGVKIGLTLDHAHTGANTARVTVTDAAGKAIPQAHVTIIANQAFVDAGGLSLDATPDPDDLPTDFAASLIFTQPGTWQVVIFVSTADQSTSASAIFAVNVPA